MGKDQRNKQHGLDLRRNEKIRQAQTQQPRPQPQKRRGRKR